MKKFKKLTEESVTINYDGTSVKDKKVQLPIKSDSTGNNYVERWSGDKLLVDECVAKAFCPRPTNNKWYYISHVDGDKNNCCADNLDWKEAIPGVVPEAEHIFCGSISVSRDGKEIKIGDETGILRERWLDDDMDRVYCYQTPRLFFPEHDELISIDEYMGKAGYVHGDKTKLKNPVIWHRDGDGMNCNADNLEWIEADDQRYIDYKKALKIDQDQRMLKYNEGCDIPDWWYRFGE